MIQIKNDILSVDISTHGAEMRRITVNGEDRLWSGDPAYWSGTSPILFPVCGSLPNQKYTYDGKEYTLAQHGFAKNAEFIPESVTENSAVFLLKSNAETLKMYPWEFEFRVSYTLNGSTVQVDYDIKNLTDRTMYVSPGAHEAYACPEGIEEYDVIFPQKETLNACVLTGSLLTHDTVPMLQDSDTLPLKTEYFKMDTLVFKDLKSRSATLRHRKTGKSATVEFDGFDYFLLWTVPGAGYICMEPWAGIPPYFDADPDITGKEGIHAISPHGALHFTHSVIF